MALTATEAYSGAVGAQKVWQGSVTFDSSYVTGGELIPASLFGLYKIDTIIVGSSNSAGIDAHWDSSAGTLVLFDEVTGTSAEEGNGNDVSSVSCNVVVFGK